ncbi:MAG: CNT family concentrative nucleoside transporter [Bacteriovoracaceae bacterium]|jgi:CNT family concentrative nucleoside transporter
MNYVQSILGLLVFIGIAFLFSEDKKSISWKKVGIAIFLQIAFALLFLKVPFLQNIFIALNQGVLMIEKATMAGASFMFGYLAGGPLPFNETSPGASFIVAFRVLPIVLIMSAISSMLFHLGILQKVVQLLSKLLQRTLNISGVQGLGVSANVFLGIVEAPLLIKPYLLSMSRSTLFIVMTAGMSTVAGTVMVLYASIISKAIPDSLGHILVASLVSTPAAILIGHLFVPGSSDDEKEGEACIEIETTSTMDALVKGTMDGIQLLLSIVAMIIVLFALVNLTNQFLAFLPGGEITLEYLVSFLFMPFVWLMGINPNELEVAANLMSTKTVLNEFVSYQKLAALSPSELSEKSRLVMTYAMCGFANLASLGLIVGSMGTLAPERRSEIVGLSFKSLIAGTLATMMTGAIVQIIL